MNQDNNQQQTHDLDQAIGAALGDLSTQEQPVSATSNSQEDTEKAAVMAAINQLPERYLICLLLHYYENLSFSEIAEVMEVNENVVVEMLGKAKRLIREALEKDGIKLRGLDNKQSTAGVPSSAISQAFAFAEADTLSAQAEEQLGHTAADVKLERRSLWSYLTESKVFKVALVIAIIAVVSMAGLLIYRQYAHFFPWNIAANGGTPVTNQPAGTGTPNNGSTDSTGNQNQAPNNADSNGADSADGDDGVSVTITPSDDTETIVIVKGQDVEEYEAFLAEKPNLTFISEDVSEGYRYTIYSKDVDGDIPQYYVIIEKITQ